MRFEDFRKQCWGSQDGRETPIKNLTTSHVVNILNWMAKRVEQYDQETYNFMEKEAELRSLISFFKNEPIPYKDNDGRWKLRGNN